jgi:Flp pilus assembly pilin Flp
LCPKYQTWFQLAAGARRGINGSGFRDDVNHMRRLLGRESGQTMAEYAVVLALLTITTAAVFLALSGGVANAMTNVTGIV